MNKAHYEQLDEKERELYLKQQRFELRQKLARQNKTRQKRRDRVSLYAFGILLLWGVMMGFAMALTKSVTDAETNTLLSVISGITMSDRPPTFFELMIVVTLLFGLVALAIYVISISRNARIASKLMQVEDMLTYLGENPEDTALRMAERRRYRQMRRMEH
ncbi:MAG: hypothetical protein FWE69_00060 [Clostridiales bacterium]|nr:hypothetical protein [Clostridiales bacterium]